MRLFARSIRAPPCSCACSCDRPVVARDCGEGVAGGPHARCRRIDASFAPACAECAHNRLGVGASESGAGRPGPPNSEVGAGGEARAQGAQRRAAGDQAPPCRVEFCAEGRRPNRAAAHGRRSSRRMEWRRRGAPAIRKSDVLVLARKRQNFRRSAAPADAGRRRVAERHVTARHRFWRRAWRGGSPPTRASSSLVLSRAAL